MPSEKSGGNMQGGYGKLFSFNKCLYKEKVSESSTSHYWFSAGTNKESDTRRYP
jgi:hypothetical protein